MTKLIMVDFKAGKKLSVIDLDARQDMPDQSNFEKYDCFCKFIEDGMVQVEVITSDPGIVIPEHLKQKPLELINWSKRFLIKDFSYDEQGVRGSLNYGGKVLFTDLPWSSIWSMRIRDTDRHQAWPVFQEQAAEALNVETKNAEVE